MEYQDLDRLIAALESTVDEVNPQKGYWRDLWGLVREIGSGFKGIRYPTRADRDLSWQRFQSLVARAEERKEEGQRVLAERQRDWEQRQWRSQQARQEVEAKAARARPLSGLEHAIADAVLAPIVVPVELVVNSLFRLVGIDNLDQLDSVHQDLLACNEQMRAAWQRFQQQKQHMLPGDRNQTYQSLQEASDKLGRAWEQWKAAKHAARARRHQEWEARQQARAASQAERERKHHDFVARVRHNISSLEDKLDKARSALYRQEAHYEDLRSKYDGAWNDSFRSRCSAWMDEARDRIASIRESIDRLEGWLSEERRKLDR